MPPLLGGAEVAAVARLERGDAIGEQRLELVGPLQRLIGGAAGGQPLVDDRQRGQRAGDELGQVAVVPERPSGEPDERVVVDPVERVGRRSGSADSVRRSVARSARSSGDRENAIRSSSPASGSASTLTDARSPGW